VSKQSTLKGERWKLFFQTPHDCHVTPSWDMGELLKQRMFAELSWHRVESTDISTLSLVVEREMNDQGYHNDAG